MATDLHKGVFSQILLKMTENDHKFKLQSKFQDYCYSFETFRRNLLFPVLFGKAVFIWLGLPDFRKGQVENLD